MFIHRSCKCLLCHKCAFFKSAANTDTDYHRRTGIGTCIFYSCQDCILHALNTICRFEHKYTAHILTAKALGCNCNLHLITTYNRIVNDSRCIVFCILTDQRIFHNRFPQVSFYITLTHAFMDCLFQRATLKVYILSNLHKYYCHSRILAYWYHIFSGYFKIILKLV